ncbi:thiamine phosphate synthase [Paenibacillus nasutitermitis]|uniref:Thiamine-phosphate synthase n=1 Tax=Paenibacillus nasutitermitis TaxID=1652958 RepID=A0A916YQS8_9BACL|nr:thiamine phosphate synthase [Paenibacillus nasutitermitis]GGD55555.1 thiamine-phosphate synthase [Paenibacillus nasutitermitis]
MNKQPYKSDIRRKLRLYLVMGSINTAGHPVEVLQAAIRGGITMFQFREKGSGSLEGQAKYSLGKQLQQVCRERGIPFIVNDDVELALELEADGVHIGQEDGPISVIRRQIGIKLLGVSAHNVEEARLALEQGADYLGVGPMYVTRSKPDAREVQGPQVIQRIREAGIAVPLVGIGGIFAANASSVMQAGADGIAVVSAITQAAVVEEAARQLLAVTI